MFQVHTKSILIIIYKLCENGIKIYILVCIYYYYICMYVCMYVYKLCGVVECLDVQEFY